MTAGFRNGMRDACPGCVLELGQARITEEVHMKFPTKALAAAAAFLALSTGAAFAAEAGMDCCKKCSCCEKMKKDTPAQSGQPNHQQHQQ